MVSPIYYYLCANSDANKYTQDLVFGSEGTAQADFERMEEINQEIGLNAVLHRDSIAAAHDLPADEEKAEVVKQ